MENILPWILFSGGLLVAYGFLISYLVFYYYRSPQIISTLNDFPQVSILIPFRNEEKNLPHLFESLHLQEYPDQNFEIILINDHSEDQSVSVYNSNVRTTQNNFRLICLPEGSTGKREAIKAGLLSAQYNWILTTDADVMMSPGWIRAMSPGKHSGINLLLGSVTLKDSKSPLVRLQILEFATLMLFTRGSANAKGPLLANGANMAFPKDLFLQFLSEAPPAKSGDDMLFLQWIKKTKPGTIYYQNHPSALVYTWAKSGCNEFINQRFRWFSKYPYYDDLGILFSGLVVLLTNILLLLIAVLSVFKPQFISLLSGFAISKLIFDTASVIPFLKNTHQLRKMVWIPVLFFLYPFYATSLLFLSFVKSTKWKGR